MESNSNSNHHAKSIKKLQKQIDKLTMDLQEFDGQQDDKLDFLCDKLDEIETKLTEVQSDVNASRNGKLIWKISNFNNAMWQAAQDKQEVALFSDIIYTGIYGYKLRAIAYPDGIASGKSTHLSLYIMIEKGEYDALLKWPFKQKVVFSLLDQNSDIAIKTSHKREELLGDRNSTSFLCPKSDSNPGWGFPKFITLERLKSGTFLKDDSIFIKVEVEPFDASD